LFTSVVLPSAVAVKNTACTITMEDIHDFFCWHALKALLQQRRSTALPVVAVTVPSSASKAYRAATAASWARQLDR
jgi:hypothetical protein